MLIICTKEKNRENKKTKEVESGEMKRVDEKTAKNMVGMMWEYVSKSEWKKYTNQTKEDVKVEQNKKKSNPKQMDGIPSDEPFVKTRKKSKNEKDSKKAWVVVRLLHCLDDV